MKRKCNHTDITDREFIRKAIHECFTQKGSKAFERSDVKELLEWCDHSEEKLIDMLRAEIVERRVSLPPVRYADRYDHSNGKLRHITIEHTKEQIYDYIASDGLDEIAGRIGHYQIACKKGQGPLYGAKVIQGWLQDESIRYGVKADAQKCYPSISKRNIMRWLRRHVKNDDLLYLIYCLLCTSDQGLPIGSYLSIRLCALYLSDLYHHIEGTYFVERRGKKRNCVKHVMINLDDIYIFGTSAKELHRVMNGLLPFAKAMGLTIKPDWRLLDLGPKNPDAHIDALGYRIYRGRITMRRRNYVKTKRAQRMFEKSPNIVNARALVSYYGMFVKHTNSNRFNHKYQASRAVRSARKVVSQYDKSKIRRETA